MYVCIKHPPTYILFVSKWRRRKWKCKKEGCQIEKKILIFKIYDYDNNNKKKANDDDDDDLVLYPLHIQKQQNKKTEYK